MSHIDELRCGFCYDSERAKNGGVRREWSIEWEMYIPVCRKHRLDRCAFPGECLMPGDHLNSECHTVQMYEQQGEGGYSRINALIASLVMLLVLFGAAAISGHGQNQTPTPTTGPTVTSKQTFYCGAPTKTGGKCKRRVKASGLLCYQHRGRVQEVDGKLESPKGH